MGLMKRIKNLVNCKGNKIMGELENPIEQIDLAIRKREEAVNKAKMDSANFIGSVKQHKRKKQELLNKVKEYEIGIKAAGNRSDKERAMKYLILKKEIDEKIKDEDNLVIKLESDSKQVKNSIEKLEKEVRNLKNKKSELAARYSTAQAKTKVNEILTDVKNDCNISIKDIEDKIADQESYADGLESFIEEDPEEELRDYINCQDNISLEEELEFYMNDGE
ncbi:MAG: PspA/IM30 family protein [Romboutsia sp.]